MEVGNKAYKLKCIFLICKQYTTKVFMCGDYEFLSKMYGISGASSM